MDRDRLALEEISPLSMLLMPGEALDQRGLAGAVVADQRGDLSGIDVEVDVVEDVHGAEALVELAGREDRFGHGVRPSRVVGTGRVRATVAGRGVRARPPCPCWLYGQVS